MSVPGDYFGKSFQKSIASLGVQDNRLYGYVVDVRKFSIRWELDKQVTHDHILGGSVRLEEGA